MDRNKKIQFTHGQYIVYEELLGNGSFGEVYSGFDTDKHREIAVKRVTVGSLSFSSKEIDVLQNLSEHDNIVRMFGHFQKHGLLWIVTQLLEGPTMDVYMSTTNPEERLRMELSEQLILAVQHLHNNTPRITHRDLKPSNIMIVRGYQLKLIDFGLAFQSQETHSASTLAGTPNYMAPEIFVGGRYDPFKTDVFATGLILLATTTFQPGKKMEHLFAPVAGMGIGQLMNQRRNSEVLSKKIDALRSSSQQTMGLLRLAKSMVNYQPDNRPDINSVYDTFKSIKKQESKSPASPAPSMATAQHHHRAPAAAQASEPESAGPVPTLLTKLGYTKFEYHASWKVGFSFHNEIVLQDNEATSYERWQPVKNIYRYSFDGEGYRGFSVEAIGRRRIEYNCNKAITCDGDILLQEKEGAPTIHGCIERQNWVQKQKYECRGVLLDCCEDGDIMYGVGLKNSKYFIMEAWNPRGNEVITLQPPARQDGWLSFLSVCKTRNRIIVTECLTNSLDMFTAQGEHVFHQRLPYSPADFKAVTRCGVGDYLMIAERQPPAVHVYNALTGEEAATLSCQQLDMSDSEWIRGLRCCEGVLHIASGKRSNETDFLRTYKVQFTDKTKLDELQKQKEASSKLDELQKQKEASSTRESKSTSKTCQII